MGHIVIYKCKKCSYKFEAISGSGMDPIGPVDEIKEELLKGIYGLRAKECIELNPDALIFYDEEATFRCDKCGNLETHSVFDIAIFPPCEIEHRCSKCKELLHKVENFDAEMICPKCHSKLNPEETLCWD